MPTFVKLVPFQGWRGILAVVGLLVFAVPLSAAEPDSPLVGAQLTGGDFLSDPIPAGMIGPDVMVLRIVLPLPGTQSGYGMVGDISAFSMGTVSCNAGDELLLWRTGHLINLHPVIAQNMYRLKDGRFEQIGMAWLKHGFLALNDPSSCGECPNGAGAGYYLFPGCSDPYSASLNGQQSNLGPRSEVNANTGYYPYVLPHPWPPYSGLIARRLQVHNADLDPVLNTGAMYFAEAQYVTADDATANNQNNNASYRKALISKRAISGIFDISSSGTDGTVPEPAIRAWKAADPTVVETEIQLSREGLFILAAKVTELGTGFWRYEYALYNMNSDRSGQSFTVPVPPGAVLTNVGFHDVDYHSGEPYDGTDWPNVLDYDRIIWATDSFEDDENANALRWGTMYNFRFDINAEPADTTATIGLFKTGVPTSVQAATVGPLLILIDCNRNSLADSCDLGCGAPGCNVPGCGTSVDCNANFVPDDCEADCNNNDTADSCDLSNGTSLDCNDNLIPDDCEPDCDGDGLPDNCDGSDGDGDGIIDCDDLCPASTPEGACVCPPLGECCFHISNPPLCLEDYPPQECVDSGGVPACFGSPCRDGCLLSDGNGDGKRDLFDYAMFQDCYSGPIESAGFVEPSDDCVFWFDLEEDGDIDLEDFEGLRDAFGGP